MTDVQLDELVGAVKAANLAGRLFWRPQSPDIRKALEKLTRTGRVVPVPGTEASLPGYVAAPKENE